MQCFAVLCGRRERNSNALRGHIRASKTYNNKGKKLGRRKFFKKNKKKMMKKRQTNNI